MDTLESFGSHLLKAISHRVSVFYDFIRKNDEVYEQKRPINPLEDFQMWLLVIYDRVISHENMKIRRHICKETLKREFLTTHMSEFIFKQYFSLLNMGLVFRDVNFYCAFSKNAEAVYQFYCRYLQNESKDVGKDMIAMLEGLF